MVNNNLSDFKLKVNNQYIYVMKCFLFNSNPIFKKIYEDEFKDEIEINSDITIQTILLILKYYSYGQIEINNDNIVNLMLFCIYYNDIDLLYELKKYISEINIEALFDVLKYPPLIKSNSGKELKPMFENFIRLNVNNIFDNIHRLSLDSLSLLISLYNNVDGNGNKILIDLLNYLRNLNNNNDIRTFKIILNEISFNKISLEELPNEYIKILDNYDIKLNIHSFHNKRKSTDVSSLDYHIKKMRI